MKRAIFGLLLLALMSPTRALAHRASDSYLALLPAQAFTLRGHWDVALGDLAYALGLDTRDRALTWGALRAHEAACVDLLRAGLRLETSGGACAMRVDPLQLNALSDGPYARLSFGFVCPEADNARLTTRLLAEVDRDHRVLLRLGQGDQAVTHVLGLAQPSLLVSLGSAQSVGGASLSAFADQIGRGLVHIFAGADHIAFLLVLLLPAVFRPRVLACEDRAPLRALLLEIAKVVTAFTAAHSLTLSLAALGFLRTSAAVIEPAIAASVALAALSNLRPRVAQEGFVLAFVLGLLHGFGLSSALSDAGLTGEALISALLGFNLGVELGQLTLVALFLPLALLSRRLSLCRRHALSLGSSAVLALSLFWLFERLQTG